MALFEAYGDLLKKFPFPTPDQQQHLDESNHLVSAFATLAFFKANPEGVVKFRARLGDALSLLSDSHTRSTLQEALALPLTKQSLETMQQAVLSFMARSYASAPVVSSVGDAERAMQALLADSPRPFLPLASKPAKPSQKVKASRKKKPEPEPEPEPMEEDNWEEVITISFAPLIWQDIETDQWKWGVLSDSLGGVYDSAVAPTFSTQEEAQSHLDQFVTILDQAPKQSLPSALLQHTLKAWESHNGHNACRDVQGTERLDLVDQESHHRLLILFTTFGPKQLRRFEEYVQIQSDAGPVKTLITTVIQPTFVTKIKRLAVDAPATWVGSGLIWCPQSELDQDNPTVALGYTVYSAPRDLSEEDWSAWDNKMFNAM